MKVAVQMSPSGDDILALWIELDGILIPYFPEDTDISDRLVGKWTMEERGSSISWDLWCSNLAQRNPTSKVSWEAANMPDSGSLKGFYNSLVQDVL